MIGQIGALLFLQIDLIVVNLIFGATSAGEYAIVFKAGTILRTIAGVLGGVMGPIILTYYAREHTEKLIRVTQSAVKLMGLSMALPIGLLCGFAPQILTVWVGVQYAFLAPLMILLTLPLVVNLAIFPLISIRIAYNQVKIPGLVSLFSGMGNFVLAVILSLFTGLGYYGVAAAGAIVLTLTNAVFNPWYTARILKVRMYTFVSSMVPGFFATLGIIATALIFSSILDSYKLSILFIAVVIISGGYLVVLLLCGLNNFERRLLRSYLPQNLKRLVKDTGSGD